MTQLFKQNIITYEIENTILKLSKNIIYIYNGSENNNMEILVKLTHQQLR